MNFFAIGHSYRKFIWWEIKLRIPLNRFRNTLRFLYLDFLFPVDTLSKCFDGCVQGISTNGESSLLVSIGGASGEGRSLTARKNSLRMFQLFFNKSFFLSVFVPISSWIHFFCLFTALFSYYNRSRLMWSLIMLSFV
jgi:hypothetical protein